MLDINLPDSTGLTTFLRAQPKAPQIPIVVLVNDGEEDIGSDAVARGALDYRATTFQVEAARPHTAILPVAAVEAHGRAARLTHVSAGVTIELDAGAPRNTSLGLSGKEGP